MNTAALVLAAGKSSRAGAQNKLLHTYRGRPLICHLVDAVQASTANVCLAVSGHQRDALEAVLKDVGIDTVFNPAYASGMASSLAAGVSALKESDAIIVCLGDMPHIDSQTIDQIIAHAESQPQKKLVVPCFEGRRGHPVLIRQALFRQVLALSGDRGAKRLFSAYPDDVLEVHVNSPAILQDYDTAEALAQLDCAAPHSADSARKELD